MQPSAPLPPSVFQFSIMHHCDDFVVIHKPPGFHVHQPERPRRRVPREQTVLWTLRRQIEQFLYPVHRLDVATEGVLLMALRSEVARDLQAEFQAGQVNKTYHLICRGWTEPEGCFAQPLERDSNGSLAAATTRYRTLAQAECAYAIGKRYQSARYSLVEATPETGRWHQIRRHFARASHPIVGDREHGDSHHNRYFRETLGRPGLWLRSSRLAFRDFDFRSPFTERWSDMVATLGLGATETLE